mgnify:CR=1 FL=1
MGTKQHQRTIDTGKHTATVNVAHKNYIGSGMQGHRQIDKVGIPQIDFGDASRAFQHNGIIASGKAIVAAQTSRRSSSRPPCGNTHKHCGCR